MITPNEVLDAVKDLIRAKYPGETLYTNLVPINFARPSFAVESYELAAEPDACGTVTLRLTVRVTCIVETDDYQNSQLELLNARQLAVMGMFLGGYLQVGDRALHVAEVKGGPGGLDFTNVTAVLEWDEDREDFLAIEEPPDDMETINLNFTEG